MLATFLGPAWGGLVWPWLLVLARTLPSFLALATRVPARGVIFGASLAVGVALVPHVPHGAPVGVAVLAREVLFGLSVAVAFAAPILAAETAGAWVAHTSGLGPSLRVAAGLHALALFGVLGGFGFAVRSFARSFADVPLGSGAGLAALIADALAPISLGLRLASPCLVTLVCVDAIAALAARASGSTHPLLDRSARAWVATAALGLALPWLGAELVEALRSSLEGILGG